MNSDENVMLKLYFENPLDQWYYGISGGVYEEDDELTDD